MKDLVKKWDDLGLLEKISNKKNLATIFEITLRILANDKNRVEEHATILYPIMREIFYEEINYNLIDENYIRHKCEFIYKKFKEEYPIYEKKNNKNVLLEEDFIKGFSLKIKNNIKQTSRKPWKFVWDDDPKIVDFDGNVVCLLSTGTIDGVYDTERILENAKILLNNND